MKTRVLIVCAVLSLLGSTSRAQNVATWLRYPAISPDGRSIVFTYKGDLYKVPSGGGAAVALTAHPAHDFMPVWSHDGHQIAFASDRYGNFDIYVMPATGGEPTRLTFHSVAEYPYTFTPGDTAVVFGAARGDAAASRLYPAASQPELYQVPVAGGRPLQLLGSPAEDVKYSKNGQFLLYHDKKGGENTWRKHHTSAITRDIWLHDTKAGTHRKLTTFVGEDRNPVFADGEKAIYYLSEESGSFNVHRLALDGTKSQQVTSFKTHPVRFLSQSNTGTLCFGQDGAIYTLAPGASPQRIAITIAADQKVNPRRTVSVSNGAQEFAVSPNGKEVAFIARGDVFVTSIEGGVTKRVTTTAAEELGVGFAPDGKAIVYASERNGRWAIYEARRTRADEPYFYAATLLNETPLVANAQQNAQPRYSPDGKELAFIENLNTLKVLNLESKATRVVLTDKELFSSRPTHHVTWSPDSKWLLFDYAVPGLAPGEVGLVRADGTKPAINLTQSGFDDSGAQWILGGSAMIWASNRDGLKSVAQAGSAQRDVYAMFFTKDAWDRFRLTKEEYALVKEADEKKEKDKPKTDTDKDKDKKDAEKEKKVEDIAIEFDGLDVRKAKLTIHSSALSDAAVSKDGETLYYLARFEKNTNLWSTNLRTKETKMLVALTSNGGELAWDKDQKNLILLAGGTLSKIEPAAGKRESIPFAAEVLADDPAERDAMFDHVWRRTRDTFYTAGYHGVDWAAMRPVYAKYLPHVGNLYEFSELLAEMLGELNISHSGSTYGGPSGQGDAATASLGVVADPVYAGPGIKIQEVIAGGPLDKAGLTVKPGMTIEAIDGVAIPADHDPAEFLNRKAGTRVLLTLADGTQRQDVVIKPITLGDESRLLYTRWVRRNQDEVDRVSQGQYGYIHIPGMNDGAFRTTFEEALGKYASRKGLIVDTRFNGGGDLVADLDMFLTGKRFFEYTTDTRSSGFEPNFRWTRPSVSLANEANYSDGHCYAYMYKALKIGPLVGMPVPGTCTFSGWESLADGVRWGVPGVGVKDSTTGKYLENLQTEPDVKVANDAAIVVTGKDQQLDAALAELRKLVK